MSRFREVNIRLSRHALAPQAGYLAGLSHLIAAGALPFEQSQNRYPLFHLLHAYLV